MKVTFVTSDAEMRQMVDAIHMSENDGSLNDAPRKVWIAVKHYGYSHKFTVCDNTRGTAETSSFDTIDGALVRALGIRAEEDDKLEYDYMGALYDHGSFNTKPALGDIGMRRHGNRKYPKMLRGLEITAKYRGREFDVVRLDGDERSCSLCPLRTACRRRAADADMIELPCNAIGENYAFEERER